ncbi:MAG: CbrC family protein [Pseudomonadota bacterium]
MSKWKLPGRWLFAPRNEGGRQKPQSGTPPPKNPVLPDFDYFAPEALKRVVKPSDEVCDCCEQRRGFLYTGPFYQPRGYDIEICPYCIKDGSAAAKFDGSFNDIVIEFDGEVINAEAAKVPDAVIDELLHRTPGYESWQGNMWAFYGGKGGIFQGDATKEAVESASEESIAHFDAINGPGMWAEFIQGYTPEGSISVYHFKLRNSEIDLFLWDMD